MLRNKKGLFSQLFVFILGFLMFASGGPSAVAASKQVIVASHMTSLRVTELERMAPPYAAFMWALANDAGFQSLKGSVHPELSYRAAFSRVVALIKPNQSDLAESWLEGLDLSASEKAALRKAQKLAKQLYDVHYEELSNAESPPADEWPSLPGRGIWRPTPPQFATPALPKWGQLGLFSEASVADLARGLRAHQPGSAAYNQELNEVWRLGGANSQERTADQTEIAKFWVGGAGTVTPPGLWIRIALQRLQEVPVHFTDSVAVMRTLSFALCDAGIAAWKVKYQQKTWRPITAIGEDLGDSSWTPLLTTPPFPGYVSGHSTFSAAAATVLGVILPLDDEPLRVTSPDLNGTVRTFKSYREAAAEAGKSRIYGGIHVEADNKDGLILGRRVGCALLEKMFEYSCD